MKLFFFFKKERLNYLSKSKNQWNIFGFKIRLKMVSMVCTGFLDKYIANGARNGEYLDEYTVFELTTFSRS